MLPLQLLQAYQKPKEEHNTTNPPLQNTDSVVDTDNAKPSTSPSIWGLEANYFVDISLKELVSFFVKNLKNYRSAPVGLAILVAPSPQEKLIEDIVTSFFKGDDVETSGLIVASLVGRKSQEDHIVRVNEETLKELKEVLNRKIDGESNEIINELNLDKLLSFVAKLPATRPRVVKMLEDTQSTQSTI